MGFRQKKVNQLLHSRELGSPGGPRILLRSRATTGSMGTLGKQGLPGVRTTHCIGSGPFPCLIH
ncbi:hypothetical protein ASZ90_016289 [hydrocarbon metagenome]|uniref:Uncharacterized protein n=1 Tax=hydrocarbon metagenome TaxID=938273 RepID=A0A0W8F020_9ZZZZ